jgi:hypothetical protein
MSEGKALALVFGCMTVVLTGVCLVLNWMKAEGTLYGLAMILVGGAAAYVSSIVVMHYEPLRRRRRRDN